MKAAQKAAFIVKKSIPIPIRSLFAKASLTLS